MQAGRKRRRKPCRESWFQAVNMRKRMMGESYTSFKPLASGGTDKIIRRERTLGPACTSISCLKSKVRYCDRFAEEDRNKIFHKFWKLLHWNQKRTYVRSLVDRHKTIRQTTMQPSRRQDTFVFSKTKWTKVACVQKNVPEHFVHWRISNAKLAF